MSAMLDKVHVLGLLVQASGAALIGLFSFAIQRSTGHRSLIYWTIAWLLLALALMLLLAGIATPRWAVVTDSAYLLAEYGYLYFLVLGLRNLQLTLVPTLAHLWFLATALVIAIVLPWTTHHEFQLMFAVQSGLLAFGFGVALFSLPNGKKASLETAGTRALRASLIVLIAIFLHYVPLFFLVALGRMPLPFDYLKMTSVAHLVAEFALGYAGALAVLEVSNRKLQLRNRALRKDGERLRMLSETDPLTGALNRRALAMIVGERAADRRECSGSVAMLDIDDMKLVNTHGGHPLGDAVLRALSATAASLVREEDLVVRWGGDEFVILACALPAEELQNRLESLPAKLRATKTLANAPPQWLGVSFGVAPFASLAHVEAAIKEADIAMFEQKQKRKPGPRPGFDESAAATTTR